MTGPRAPSPTSRAVVAGGLAGLVVGAGDVAVSWGGLGQFTGTGGKLLTLVHVASLYAVALAVLAPLVVGAIVLLVRHTAFGGLLRGRERDPVTVLALTIAGLACSGGALAAAFSIGYQTILRRHHKGLIVAVTIGATVGLLLLAVPATFALGRLLETALRPLARRRAGGFLAHPWAPVLFVVGLLAVGAIVGAVAFSSLLAQVPHRPWTVSLVALVALVALWPAVRWTPRRAILIALPVLLLVVSLVAGRSDGVRKAAGLTGLERPLTQLLRRLTDFDRDGYAAILGGGDCAAFDSRVHPGARQLPGDGVDQNCAGGDPSLGRRPEDTGFVALPAAVPRDLNVLLITIDTLRADHVGAYGYTRPTTPVIDALAADGFLFENAWAHAPSTRYSIPAIMTGRYPSQVRWDTSVWWPALAPENETVAEIMKSQGLGTGAILNYHYFDPVRRMNQGFDRYDNQNARLHAGRDPASTEGSSAREQSDLAIEQLRAQAGKRFFLWVHYYDPHYRYQRHPGVRDFGGEPIDLYDHEILFTDEQLGRVIDELRALGLYDRTVIAVTGDHGEGFGEGGIEFHGYHLYAAQTKVPLVVRVPGLGTGRPRMPVGHVDLVPTLANLVGAPARPAMAGLSLVAEMAGLRDRDRNRVVFQEVTYEGPTDRRAAVDQDWQLIYNVVPDNTFELYSLADPVAKRRDRSGDTEAPALRQALLSWIDTVMFPPEAAEALAGAVRDDVPTPTWPTRATFDDDLGFLGVDVSPTSARPGQTVTFTWYFRPGSAIHGDWRAFVHLEGARRFLGDHDLVAGVLPIEQWPRGKVIVDRHVVTVPPGTPAGPYLVRFGLYRGQRRMPVQGGGDRVSAGTLEVLP